MNLQKNCRYVLAIVCMAGLVILAPIGANALSLAPAAEPPETQAQTAVVMDQDSGQVIWQKEGHRKVFPASVTKVMTMVLLAEALQQGKIRETDMVDTSERAWFMGGSEIYLEVGERMSVRDLFYAIALQSANDACVAVGEHLAGSEKGFVEMMNRKAQQLGMKDTHFVNTNGLHDKDHYTSAYDIALMTRYAMKFPRLVEFATTKFHNLRENLAPKKRMELANKNKLLWWYRGADGLKTGWTPEAGYNLAATAKRDGLRLVVAVCGCPVPQSHFREAMKYFTWGFAQYGSVPIVTRNSSFAPLKVTSGKQRMVHVGVSEDFNVTVLKGEEGSITQKIELPATIGAPISKGQQVGQIIVKAKGKKVASVPILAKSEIAKASLWDLIIRVADGLF